ncbi:Cell envelope protein [Pseudomonas sp. IT-P253]
MTTTLPRTFGCAMLLLASFTSSLSHATEITAAETKAIAEEGYVYGLPIVMNYAVMYDYAVDKNSSQFKAPFNHMHSLHHVATPTDTAIITPNSDTPYSMMFMDVRAEPIVLSVPAVEKPRYYSVQLIDGNTYNFGYIGSRATGNEAGDYMVVGPDWKGVTPPGIKKVFHSRTQLPFAAYRTQLYNPADMPNVEKIQSGYTAQPLSAYLKQPAPPAAPAIDFPKIDKALAKTDFFKYLGFALQFAPATPDEAAIRAKLARLGIGAGKDFDFQALSAEQKAAVIQGMQAGHAKVEEGIQNLGTKINGWNIASTGGDAAFYHGDWLKRAAIAQAGIYGNNSEEATYPLTRTLPNGEPLDGSKHSYTITFPAGQLPPVNAFWSVTMYDGKSQLLIKNPINRYLLNSPMLPDMKKNADGSLTLYIQKDSPGADNESNWLPAPNDLIYMVMRLYWPKTENPSVLPPGKGTWSPPSIVKIN